MERTNNDDWTRGLQSTRLDHTNLKHQFAWSVPTFSGVKCVNTYLIGADVDYIHRHFHRITRGTLFQHFHIENNLRWLDIQYCTAVYSTLLQYTCPLSLSDLTIIKAHIVFDLTSSPFTRLSTVTMSLPYPPFSSLDDIPWS